MLLEEEIELRLVLRPQRHQVHSRQRRIVQVVVDVAGYIIPVCLEPETKPNLPKKCVFLISRVRVWVAHLSFAKGNLWSLCQRRFSLFLYIYANISATADCLVGCGIPLKSHLRHSDWRWPSAKLRWVTQTLTQLYRIHLKRDNDMSDIDINYLIFKLG